MSCHLPTILMNCVGLSDLMARRPTVVNSVTYLVCACYAVD